MFCTKPSRYGEIRVITFLFSTTYQIGVIRSNCIDCLDRTNIVHFFIGKYALGHQVCVNYNADIIKLFALGILESPHLVDQSAIVKGLMHMYEELGDKIALQVCYC